MIQSATFRPRAFTAPAARPTPVAAGGAGFNQDGDLVVQKDVLGFIPVQATLGLKQIVAGDYGRDFRIDFADPTHATLSGRAHYGPFDMDIDQPLAIKSGGVLETLSFHVNDDQTLQLQGYLKVFGMKIPFDTNVTPTELSHGVYRFTFNAFRLGKGGTALPPTIAAWTTSFVLNVLGGMSGVRAADLKQLEINFAQLKPDSQ